MPHNSLVILRENFKLEREANIVEVTAHHPRLGRRSVLVCVPSAQEKRWEEYAMLRWVAIVGTE